METTRTLNTRAARMNATIKARPTQARLKELFSYDPDTGEFRWLTPSWPDPNRVGKVVGEGRKDAKNYLCIVVDGRKFKAHQLAWLYVHGEWASLYIDHINGDRSDNRIANLRLATQSQNVAAGKLRANKSGFRGVHFHRYSGLFPASLTVRRKQISLGYHKTAEAAHAAYVAAARRHWGEFARID